MSKPHRQPITGILVSDQGDASIDGSGKVLLVRDLDGDGLAASPGDMSLMVQIASSCVAGMYRRPVTVMPTRRKRRRSFNARAMTRWPASLMRFSSDGLMRCSRSAS